MLVSDLWCGHLWPQFTWPVITSPIFIQFHFVFFRYHLHLNCHKICSETISIWGVPENLRFLFKISKAFLWKGGMKLKIVYSEKYAIENTPFSCFWCWYGRGLSRRGQWYAHIYTQGLHDNIIALLLWEFCFDFFQPGPERSRGWFRYPKKA